MQWRILLAIIFALIVAVFAVANVHAEPIHYLFGVAYVPLVLIILGAALMGGLSVASFGLVGWIKLRAEIRRLRRELQHEDGAPAMLPFDPDPSPVHEPQPQQSPGDPL